MVEVKVGGFYRGKNFEGSIHTDDDYNFYRKVTNIRSSRKGNILIRYINVKTLGTVSGVGECEEKEFRRWMKEEVEPVDLIYDDSIDEDNDTYDSTPDPTPSRKAWLITYTYTIWTWAESTKEWNRPAPESNKEGRIPGRLITELRSEHPAVFMANSILNADMSWSSKQTHVRVTGIIYALEIDDIYNIMEDGQLGYFPVQGD